jgi:hypothetical protein
MVSKFYKITAYNNYLSIIQIKGSIKFTYIKYSNNKNKYLHNKIYYKNTNKHNFKTI